MAIVNTCWGPKNISDQVYWHLVPQSGIIADMFKNNVRVGKGALLSVSASTEAESHLENAHTPYSLSRNEDLKERIFEEVRQINYPHLPSRIKTLYVFDEYKLVKKAQADWFQNEQKEVHECHILSGSKFFKADTALLNSPQNQWKESALKYWCGKMSENPFPEVLVHGALYFPNWSELMT